MSAPRTIDDPQVQQAASLLNDLVDLVYEEPPTALTRSAKEDRLMALATAQFGPGPAKVLHTLLRNSARYRTRWRGYDAFRVILAGNADSPLYQPWLDAKNLLRLQASLLLSESTAPTDAQLTAAAESLSALRQELYSWWHQPRAESWPEILARVDNWARARFGPESGLALRNLLRFSGHVELLKWQLSSYADDPSYRPWLNPINAQRLRAELAMSARTVIERALSEA